MESGQKRCGKDGVMSNVLTAPLSCGVLLIVVTPLGFGYLVPLECKRGNTNTFALAWMSFHVPKQEKEDKDEQARADSLLTGGTKLGGRLVTVGFVNCLTL